MSVTVSAADFWPMVAYVFDTDAVIPERPSVPLHEYEYEREPPETTGVHVTDWPMKGLPGAPEHETVGAVVVSVMVFQSEGRSE